MQGGRVKLLRSNIRMARHAAICHSPGLPKECMAGCAPRAEVGMGGCSSQGCARLCVEGTRTEKDATTNKPNNNYDDNGQKCSEKAWNGQAAEWFFSHYRPLPEQGGITECSPNMDEGSHEKRHTDRNVDCMPDGHQTPGTGQRHSLVMPIGQVNFHALQCTGNSVYRYTSR